MLSSLFLMLASFQSPSTMTSFVVSDPSLLIDSASTGVLAGALGNQLDFAIDGTPSGWVFLAFSPTPPFGAGSIGGVPIEVDLATVGYLLQGLQLDPTGHLTYATFVPDNLPTGISIWTQAAVVAPADLAIQLSGGVRIDLVQPNPSDLPLLELGRHAGVRFSTSGSTHQAALDAAYLESLTHGCDTYTLHIAWDEIEVAPGVYDPAPLLTKLQLIGQTGHEILLVLETIDGRVLRLPSDLLDPADPTHLAPRITWASQSVNSRFSVILDFVAASLADHNGFFLSVGNEVDLYLDDHPEQLSGFAVFVSNARDHVHATQPKLAVGVTLTAEGALQQGATQQQMAAASDLLAFTYFPLAPGFVAASPMVPLGDLPSLSALVAPFPLLLQEVGYGSGALPLPTAGASLEKQALFFENVFDAMLTLPKLRFVLVEGLADLGTKDLAELANEHDNYDPAFLENRATVGLLTDLDASAKPAWAEFLAGLDSL